MESKDTKIVTVKDYDNLDLSNLSRNDNEAILICNYSDFMQSLEIIKDKKTKWFTFRLVRLDKVNKYTRERTFVNLSFDNIQEFREKIKEIWNKGETI